MLTRCHSEWRQQRKDCANEDSDTTTKPLIKGIGEPSGENTDNNVWASIDETLNPSPALTLGVGNTSV
jgi:hypothetical protein